MPASPLRRYSSSPSPRLCPSPSRSAAVLSRSASEALEICHYQSHPVAFRKLLVEAPVPPESNPACRVVAERRRVKPKKIMKAHCRQIFSSTCNLQLSTFPLCQLLPSKIHLLPPNASYCHHDFFIHRSHRSRKNTKEHEENSKRTLKGRPKNTQSTRKNTKEHLKTLKEQPLAGGPITRLLRLPVQNFQPACRVPL